MLYLEFLNYKNYNCFAENSSNFLKCGSFGWVRFVFGMMSKLGLGLSNLVYRVLGSARPKIHRKDKSYDCHIAKWLDELC